MDEDHQEISEHLERRSRNARRMSRMASATMKGEGVQHPNSKPSHGHVPLGQRNSAPPRGPDQDSTSLLPGVPVRPTTGLFLFIFIQIVFII